MGLPLAGGTSNGWSVLIMDAGNSEVAAFEYSPNASLRHSSGLIAAATACRTLMSLSLPETLIAATLSEVLR